MPSEYRALHDESGVAIRSTLARLHVSGADRRRYLQGLLSNDIEALAPGMGCYAAYLTPQGRMISDVRVFEIGDRLLVDLDRRAAARVVERWSAFIFSDDVEVVDVTESTSEIGVYGPGAARVLANVLRDLAVDAPASAETLESMPVHANREWVWKGDPIVVLRSDDVGVQGYDVVLPIGREAELAELARRHGARDVGESTLETSRIEAGRPRFFVDMDEETIPLEAGIEDRAISLTKGCYVGQEIIIRVLHRGQGRVAKRLVGVLLGPAAEVPARGDALRAGDREIGSITSAAQSPALGRPIALGYVHRDFTEPGTAVTVWHDGAAVEGAVSALPFVSG